MSWLPIGMTEADSGYDGPFSTYQEAHAATIGFALGVLPFIAHAMQPALAIPFGLQALRVAFYALTGQRLELKGRRLGLPDKYLSQIRHEVHYYLGALVLGLAIGAAGYHGLIPVLPQF